MRMPRREMLMGAAALAGVAGQASAETGSTPLMPEVPLVPPKAEFVWEAVVTLLPTITIGDSALGERRIVPITGGSFAGPRLRGSVMAGGADRQLIRRDGVRKLDALYELQTDDGVIITVRNQVTIAPQQGGPDYRFSTIEVIAPSGPYDWLNRLAFVGTLHSLPPERRAVLVRVYALG